MLLLFYRTTLLYLLIIGAVRLMGKRQISQMQPTEFVTTILISNIVTLAIEDSDFPLITGIMPTMLLICYEVFSSYLNLKFPGFRKRVTGRSITVIEKGKLLQKNLQELRMTVDDLLEQLRISGVFDIREVYYARIETNGQISVLKKISYGENNCDTPPPVLLISDGNIQREAVRHINKDMRWLENKLCKLNVKVSDVFIGMYDESKNKLFVIKRDNQ